MSKAPDETPVVSLILAAGKGSRMGMEKGLILIGQWTLAERISRMYEAAGLSNCIVVVAPDSRLPSRMASRKLTFLENPDPSRGPISSIWTALDVLPAQCEALILHPVDVPVFDARVVDSLIAAFRAGRGSLIIPTHGGRRGHPILMSRRCFPLLRQAPLDVGARYVHRKLAHRIHNVAVHCRWVTHNLNTPVQLAEFRRAFTSGDHSHVQ